ncbi:MAG: hypothetical protein LBR93_11440 [Treponema sp.]|nr:hypothetical protein [Treponema sp.]
MSREITAFSQLKELVRPILKSHAAQNVILRVFDLIKQLNWGFFADVSPKTHRKLWREMVVSDMDFPEAGDIKRTMQVANIYICMLDIHGYTKFCQESRNNLSRLHTLDRIINHEVRQIATQCQSVSRRDRGDEIVVVSPSATDALTVTLSIIDYFAKTEVVKDPAISNRRKGGAANNLPVFKISAGITGGNTTSPLIVTEDGDLSGFLLNIGARLQTRANELSPQESRVMVSKQVQMSFIKENQVEKRSLFRDNAVYFLDTGMIEFKGVMLPTCEAVFTSRDRYKEKISESLQKLFGAIRENLWEQRIFLDILELIARTAVSMPPFMVNPPRPMSGLSALSNQSVMDLCRQAARAYTADEDYPAAIGILRQLVEVTGMMPDFDRLIFDYLQGISARYDSLLTRYDSELNREIEAKAKEIFADNTYKTLQAAKNGALIYEKLLARGRKSKALTKKKILWYKLIKESQEELAFTLYSGKK